MQGVHILNEHLRVGPEPSEEDLSELAGEGTRAVIDLRADGEETALAPEEEQRAARQAGLTYVRIPVRSHELHLDQVDEFRQRVSREPGPIYVHSHSGRRAGTLALLHVACEEGWTEEKTLQRAREMGFGCDEPEIKQFIEGYLRKRRD